MSDYNEALSLFKKLNGDGAASAPAPARKKSGGVTSKRIHNESDLSMIDEAVFGAYIPPENENGTFNVMNETLKELREGKVSEETKERIQQNVANSKMPKGIIDSIINNPLVLDDSLMEDKQIDAVAARASRNIGATKAITEKLESMDRSKREEMPRPAQQQASAPVDYALIKSIIESAIDERMSELKSRILTESAHGESPALTGIKMVNDSTLWLLDSDNNVYECTMRYKGKKKQRK